MTAVYVAAGGGGDALAAAIVNRAPGGGPAVIATNAWDRLSIDPVPGPRGPADFRGLAPLGRHNHVVTRTSVPRSRRPARRCPGSPAI